MARVFAETIVACLALGMLAGFGWAYVLLVDPAARRADSQQARVKRAYRHLGTPYREETVRAARQVPPLPLEIAVALLDPEAIVDNDRWSRGVDGHRVISLPTPRVQTGRPA